MLQEYLHGEEDISFMYPSGIDHFKEKFIDLEEQEGKEGKTSPLQKHYDIKSEMSVFEAATVGKPASIGRIQKNFLDRFRNCTSRSYYRSVSKQKARLDNLPRREAEFENPLLEGSEGLEVLALSHTDFSDLFSVLLDAVNFPHMAKILPVGIHLRQVLVIGFILMLVLTGLLGTTLSTLEVLEGLVLKILGEITLTVCITFDSRVEGAEFEVSGLDKAFVLSTLERTEDFGKGVTE
ncbi:hypothetical protein Tco_0727970 [Tanacetum coccineum]|uniref:Uncharacterized protein n=1 Tax=Tanacetum coccineum TaxID=301880 RepID=A0ABQ4YJT8_9ASTR